MRNAITGLPPLNWAQDELHLTRWGGNKQLRMVPSLLDLQKHIGIHNITTTKGTPCTPPGSHHESPSRASEGQRNTNLTNTGGRLVDGAGKQVEGETRAAEERPVLGESREFSAVWVLARLEVDSVRCSLGPRDVE